MTTNRNEEKRIRPTAWKLEDAKAHFSEVVRRARSEGPQLVTCRGADAVVILAAERAGAVLAPKQPPLIEFLQASGLGDLVIERAEDRGREVEL